MIIIHQECIKLIKKFNSTRYFSKNRQKLSKIYHRNGLIYLFKTSNLKKYNDFYGKKIFHSLLKTKEV